MGIIITLLGGLIGALVGIAYDRHRKRPPAVQLKRALALVREAANDEWWSRDYLETFNFALSDLEKRKCE